MPRRLKGIDYHQSTEPDLLFRDVSLNTQTITAPAQAPGVIHQTIASAYAGPRVAHLTLPQDVLSSKVEHAVPSVATLHPRAEIAPDDHEIDAVMRRIDAAESVVIRISCRRTGTSFRIQALDRSRQVIALIGDGGFNMLTGEFLTAVHHHLPVKIVIFDNAAFGLITLEAESVGILPFREAIEFSNPDYAALARACGAQGFTVSDPALLEAILIEAFACPGPAIVACSVAPDEMPNLPHVELEQVGSYAIAKIKEAIAAVSGG
ncbi:thiamine pyrophosphate-dependent enzyme [Luteibacter sp.]|jgi:thiamine pyrophosphate-dependent acetolactate synthase large subunit-like protein|uniref:thiamine pyrophosphate-dependent enzyme n=1 Tax=Luteibacter sp. TaxID=1886636 RepID=UPI002F4295EE